MKNVPEALLADHTTFRLGGPCRYLLDCPTPDEIKQAEREATALKKTLKEVLLNKGLIKEGELKRLEAYILGVPFVDLEKEIVPPQILQIIPEPIARKHNIVAFRKVDKDLEVAMLDPDDIQTIEFIRKKEGLRILPRLFYYPLNR